MNYCLLFSIQYCLVIYRNAKKTNLFTYEFFTKLFAGQGELIRGRPVTTKNEFDCEVVTKNGTIKVSEDTPEMAKAFTPQNIVLRDVKKSGSFHNVEIKGDEPSENLFRCDNYPCEFEVRFGLTFCQRLSFIRLILAIWF